VTSCSVVAGYQRFGAPNCLHLEDEVSKFQLLNTVLNFIKFFKQFNFKAFRNSKCKEQRLLLGLLNDTSTVEKMG